MYKYGIHYAYWGRDWDVDLSERIRKAADVGFDCIEITPPSYFIEMDKKRMDMLKYSAESTGIEMSFCIGFPENKDMASEDVSVRKAGIEYTKKILDSVQYMGGKILSGILYSYWPYNFSSGVPDKEKTWQRAVSSVKEVAPYAADKGIIYAIEAVNRFEQFLVNSVDEGLDFIEEVDQPGVGLLLDTFHMNIEEDSPAEAILKAGDKLAHLHISQNNRKLPFPGGTIQWDEIGCALKGIGYNGRIVMEPFVLKDGPVAKDIHIWRDLVCDTSETTMNLELHASLEYIKNVFE